MNDPDTIRVQVAKYPDRPNLVLRYIDPTSGKQKTKSAGTTDEVTAIGAAAVWQDELQHGRYQAPSKLTWAQFRKRYETEKVATLAAGTGEAVRGAFAHLERVLNPDRITKITTAALSRLAAELRKETPRCKDGLSEASIARDLRQIKAALRWGERMGLIVKAPRVEIPRIKGRSLARSRAVTTEEYERLLVAVPKVRPRDSAAWVRLLEAAWLSGLRLRELLSLSWDMDAALSLDLSYQRPVLRIRSDGQKSGRDETIPLAPDFGQWLLRTPEPERVGLVYPMLNRAGKPMRPSEVGRVVGEIGRKAGVVTNKTARPPCDDARPEKGLCIEVGPEGVPERPEAADETRERSHDRSLLHRTGRRGSVR